MKTAREHAIEWAMKTYKLTREQAEAQEAARGKYDRILKAAPAEKA